jgi:hypothetical protein
VEAEAIEWLTDRLVAIATEALPYAAHVAHYAANYHAAQIRGAWLAWYWRFDNHAIEVRGTKRLHTSRVPVKFGALAELRRLLRAAKSRSAAKYARMWLGTSGKTLARVIAVWPAVPPPVIWREFDADARLVNFKRADFLAAHRRVAVGGHVRIMPPQDEAVRLIQIALQRYQMLPLSERRARKVDTLADDLARAVCVAHFDLTHRGGLTWNPVAERWEGGLIELARAIEATFDIEAWFVGRGHRRRGAFSVDRLRKFISSSVRN